MRIKHDNDGSRVLAFVSAAGYGIKQMYRGKLDKETMMIELVPDGEKNVYAEIQSWKDSVDINKIIERYRAGEIDILNQVQGTYGDFSATPKDLASALELAEKGRQDFDRLPIEIKQKFDNNALIWMSTAGSEKWLQNMGFVQNVQSDDRQREEKVGENNE